MRALRILFAFGALLLTLCAAIPVAAKQKDKIDILFDEINQLIGSDKLAEALNLAIKTRDIAEKEFGIDDRRFNSALRAVALMHMQLHQFDEAEPIYQQVLAKQEQLLGPDDEDVAKTLSQFGTRIISIIEKAKGPESLDLLKPIEDLASGLSFKKR